MTLHRLKKLTRLATYADCEQLQDEPVSDSTSAIEETVQEEPAKINPVINCETCAYHERDKRDILCRSCNDFNGWKPIKIINKQIAKLCETPEPKKPKPDYTESLIETLREAIEFREIYYFMPIDEPEPPKSKSLFLQAHQVLNGLETIANISEIEPTHIVLNVAPTGLSICMHDSNYNRIDINKKYQPTAGTAD